MPETMSAVRIHEFGGPETLRYEQAPMPLPGRDEVLIRVEAAAINPPDWYMREGMPGVPRDLIPPFQMPLTLGTDVSGTVVAVGHGVHQYAVGDEVFGLLRFPDRFQAGTYAEYVNAPVTDLARKPAGVDHLTAAGLSMSGLTAWQFLIELGHDHPSPFQDAQHRPVPIDDSTTVLVNGAAGGVGHLALQLAKWKGARVIAVASGEHEQFLRSLGADDVIDYTEQRPEDEVSGVDIVMDAVGGTSSARLLNVLKPGGSIFPLYLTEYDHDELAARNITASSTQVRADGQQLGQLAALAEQGLLKVAIDQVHLLSRAVDAHERASRGHIRGKLLLVPKSTDSAGDLQ